MKQKLILLFFVLPLLLNAQTVVNATDSLPQGGGYMLPSPLQLSYIFMKYGLKYDEKFTFDLSKTDQLANSYSQCISLGICQSDLGYCVVNDKGVPGENYMKNVVLLSEKLGMPCAALEKRYHANTSNFDSLLWLLSEYQVLSDEFFISHDRQLESYEIFAGAMIECLYLAGEAPHKPTYKLENQMADMYGILLNLVENLKKYEANDLKVHSLTDNLSAIAELIIKIPGVKEMMDSERPDEVNIAPLDGQMNELRTKIRAVREELTR